VAVHIAYNVFVNENVLLTFVHTFVLLYLPPWLGQALFAYADEEYAVIYECDQQLEDGTCHPDKTIVDVLSRSYRSLRKDTLEKLLPIIKQLCIQPEDLRPIPHFGKENSFRHSELVSPIW
jgi:hypothetical protein